MHTKFIRNRWNRLNTLRPRQNGRHFADAIFKCIFLNENAWISLEISLKFVPKIQINNIPALVQIMAWRRPGDKPLSEPMMVSLLTHICVTRPQWVDSTLAPISMGRIRCAVTINYSVLTDRWFEKLIQILMTSFCGTFFIFYRIWYKYSHHILLKLSWSERTFNFMLSLSITGECYGEYAIIWSPFLNTLVPRPSGPILAHCTAGLNVCYNISHKKTARHNALTIVSWPNPWYDTDRFQQNFSSRQDYYLSIFISRDFWSKEKCSSIWIWEMNHLQFVCNC